MFNMINFNYFLNIQEDTAMKQDKNSSIDTPLKNRLDWVTTIIPFVTILALCSLFMIFPDAHPGAWVCAFFSWETSLEAIICSLDWAP